MWKDGSSMAPELITERVIRAFREHDIPDAEIYTAISDALASDVGKLEVMEYHDAITRRFVYDSARNTLADLQAKMDSPGALDTALEQIRGLKAIQPEKEADLGQQMQAALAEASGGREGLIPFGIPTLDDKLGGFNRGEVEIIAGRPGHGKTSFACQLVLNWLEMGYKVLVVSKEMTTSRLIHKLLVNVSSLSSDTLKKGELNEEERSALHTHAQNLTSKYKDQLYIHDDIYDDHKIETLVAKYGVDIVVDDFIQLSKMDDGNIRLELMRIMKHYKEIAKTYNLTFVTLSQLNRGIEGREDPRPRLSDLAESGSLEQLAADVLFVYYAFKVDYSSPKDKVEILASKTRYGETCRVELKFLGDHMRYREMPRLNV